MSRPEPVAIALILSVGLGLNYWFARQQFEAASGEVAVEREHEPVRLPSANTMEVLFLGFETMAADVAWISCAVRYGPMDSRDPFPPYVLRNARLISELDPYFKDVYGWLSGFYTQNKTSITLEDVEAVNDLLDRGMRYFPDDFWLPFDAGMNHVHAVDYDNPREKIRGYSRAIEYLETASRLEGGPEHLPMTVAWLHERRMQLQKEVGDSTDGTSAEQSRRRHVQFLSEMYYLVENPNLRRSIGRELRDTKAGRRALNRLRRKFDDRLRTRHAETMGYLPVPLWSSVARFER